LNLGGIVQLNYNATAAQVQAAMQAIVGANNCVTDVEPNNGVDTSLPDVTILITFCGKTSNNLVEMGIAPTIFPQPSLAIAPKTTDIFVMRLKQSSSLVLDPLVGGTESMMFFGGDFDETLAGFGVMPESNPLQTDPVVFAFGGVVASAVPGIPGNPTGPQSGYVTKVSFANTTSTLSPGKFTIDPLVSRYVSGGSFIDLTGIAIDRQGSVYSGGTVHFTGNADTSVSPGSSIFTTTPNVFTNGRLLRNDDLFIQKYTSNGNLAYSALIGGNDFDIAGGLDTDNDGTVYNTGSTIAVDTNLDLYITGISGSFNFPRTRGVYGEVFNNSANVTVTKVNTDASQILYSTNLQTAGTVNPGGIAVDLRGDAFITGNVHPDWVNFPDSLTQNPLNAGNPNEPNNQPLGQIQTTPDALVSTNMQPANTSELATVKGFLNILDPAADALMYGTYLGGKLDDRVFGPYVDSFGDVWVFGWVDVFRAYSIFSSSGNPTTFITYGPLPAAMISPLAFKNNPDAHGDTNLNGILYGLLSTSVASGYIPWNYPPSSTAPNAGPEGTLNGVDYRMDGWLDKLRVGLASVQSVTLNPSTIPGGLGATTTGTVTLSQAAPNGGADIVLTLLNNTTAASFSSGTPTSTSVITIPAGATTGTFTIYSQAVTANTPVQVQATYQGTFQIGLFTVTPWLQQLSLTPTSVVGGNSVSGRITLATVPPTGSGGVNVTVLTDSPNLITFPAGAIVNVPEGQTSVTFQISTAGVGVITFPKITASLLGVGITQTLTLELASLSTLSFVPASVAGGTPATGTLTLNGQATGPLIVDLTSANSQFTFADPKTGAPITTLSFNNGDSAKSFTVLTPYEASNTQDVITATIPTNSGNYAPQSISATLFVSAVDLSGLTVAPAEVAGGGTSQGTVSISSAAPAGGVVVNLSTSNAAVAQVPASVTVPSGATTAVFTITTTVISTKTPVTIIATRGPVQMTAPLTVDGVSFGLSLSPQSVVGGAPGVNSVTNLPNSQSTGTITLTSAAPATGLLFDITLPAADDQYAFFGSAGTFTTTAFVAGNSTTGTFTINTAVVPTMESVPITANVHGQTTGGQQATLQVQVTGVSSLTFTPSVIRGRGAQVTFCTVTLSSPAPAGGFVVQLSQTQKLLNLTAANSTITIPAGVTSYKVPTGYTGIAVSRSLSTVITASPISTNGTSTTALVVVTR